MANLRLKSIRCQFVLQEEIIKHYDLKTHLRINNPKVCNALNMRAWDVWEVLTLQVQFEKYFAEIVDQNAIFT